MENQEGYTDPDRLIDNLIERICVLPREVSDEVISTLIAVQRVGRTYKEGIFRRTKDTLSLLQKAGNVTALVEEILEFSEEQQRDIVATVMARKDINRNSLPISENLVEIAPGLYTDREYDPHALEGLSTQQLIELFSRLFEKKPPVDE